MATATSPRRKYRFPDRASAEEAEQMANHQTRLQLRLARALYACKVKWTGQHRTYRAGLFDYDSCNPKIVWVFAPGSQEPTLDVVEVYGETDILTRMEQAAQGCPRNEADEILTTCREMRLLLRGL
jgi:hypothetical protein